MLCTNRQKYCDQRITVEPNPVLHIGVMDQYSLSQYTYFIHSVFVNLWLYKT